MRLSARKRFAALGGWAPMAHLRLRRALLAIAGGWILAGGATPALAASLEPVPSDDAASAASTPGPASAASSPTEAPVAENVDLSKPVYDGTADETPEDTSTGDTATVQEPQTAPEPEPPDPLVLLGEAVPPGTSARLSWSLDNRFEGIAVPTPVLVVHGVGPGPTVCLTAAVHGDELNGIEIVRRVLYNLDSGKLQGTVVGVPIVNLPSFRRGSRYLPDRRDLNRYFPGTAHGSAASRIAFSFFEDVIRSCDALVDIHTGSLHRTNLPQLRADLYEPSVARLAEKFGATAVLHSAGAEGTLRRAAVEAGIPAVTIEAGEPYRLNDDDIAHGAKAIETLLEKLGMLSAIRIWGAPEPVYYQSVWVRADRGGLLFGSVELGEEVSKGDVLGIVSDPITNLRSELRAPRTGRVLGMAVNQIVMPGFAAFRIGIPSDEPRLSPSLEGPVQEAAPVGDEDENS